ncbi:MAG TPA: lipoyl(octanoyl) transferase LipB [Candidatus Binataceae bacterium]
MDVGRPLGVARLGVVDYEAALGLQTAMVAARLRDEIGDTLLILEHDHVFTLGRGADERFIVAAPAAPIHRVSRGGQVTYHGPGQLVGYPILKLEGSSRDVTKYLRLLEQVMIDVLAEYGIDAERRAGFTGVWARDREIGARELGARKIGSIGVGIRRWVTYHGFALNVSTDLSYFDAIVPCGLSGCEMTSAAALGHREVTIAAMAGSVSGRFAAVFGYDRAVAIEPHRLWKLVPERTDETASGGAEASR